MAIIVLLLLVGVYMKFSHSTPVPDTSTPAAVEKLNIDEVCKSALAYMSFPDAASADAFVAECKEGKHPEVIERYTAQMNLGDGATI